MKKSYLFLAEGFEELEAIAVVDVLRRGGIDVQTVAIGHGKQVSSAHGVVVEADLNVGEVESEEAECLIFPGGMPGAQNLANCKALIVMLQRQYDEGRHIAAICAAPALVLSQLKAEHKLHVTCYPGFETYLPQGFEVSADGVVIDGKVITAKGPGFAVRFGLAVLEQLRSAEVAKEVAAGMLL